MTKDIVQSDIDLARRLLDSRQPTAEVVAALLRRGVSQGAALRLIEDLQLGRTVTPRLPVPERRAPAAADAGPAAQDRSTGEAMGELEERLQFPPAPKAKVPGQRSRIMFYTVLAITLLSGGAYYFYHLHTHTILMRLQRASDELASAAPDDQPAKLQAVKELLQSIPSHSMLSARERIVVQRIRGQLDALTGGSITNTSPDHLNSPQIKQP